MLLHYFSNFRAHSAQRILSSSICIDWWLLELLGGQFHLVIFILKKLEAPLQLLQMCFILIQCDIDLETPLCGKKTCYMKTFSIKKKFRFSGSRFLSIIFFLIGRPFNNTSQGNLDISCNFATVKILLPSLFWPFFPRLTS